ncbi:MAG: selenide, water dikinase SelD [Gemmatimonadetes bacterium]|nr:selenide, water dikinase SelD [Gemmatimonadota bacterium]
MSPVGLKKLLDGLPQNADPNLMVGFQSSDDAGVYRMDGETALVLTADFITPPVDDPFVFGQIGAANALSDVYAMGGRPIACLNLIGFPSRRLGPEVLEGIVEGALSKITEAGAVLAGGHTTDDEEPKFGLSVTGVVHPEEYWHNAGARLDDLLILTKPIGSGVLFNANLKGWVSDAALKDCLDTTSALNKTSADVMAGFDIHAATDVTGFGLAGHALEIARGSGLTLEISAADVPVMPEALEMYEKGVGTGANAANRELIRDATRFDAALPERHDEIFVDPQTSGGLLVSVSPDQGRNLLTALHDAGERWARIIGSAKPLDGSAQIIFA